MRDQDNLIIMEKLDSLPSETHIDVLIMAASVDKRCYAVFEKFLTNCITIDRIVILDYAKTRPMPKSSEYSEYYKLNSYPNVEYIPCNTDGYDCEYISKADFSSSSKVFIDITSSIFQVLYHQFQQTGLAAAPNAGYHLDRLGIPEANQLLQINIALF